MSERSRFRRRFRSRQARARLGGYFWMPCPRCGEHYGGHEVVGRITLPDPTEPGLSQLVCPPCETELGDLRSVECKETGHRPVEQWHSVTTAASAGEVSISLAVDGPPHAVYCDRCGTDLEHTL